MKSLLGRLRELAESSPQHVALEAPDRRVLTIELLALVQELALQLRAMDVETIGLLADNSVDWVVVDLAAQIEGVCLVPLPLFFSDGQIHHVVNCAGLDAVFYDSGVATRVSALFGAGKAIEIAATTALSCVVLVPQEQVLAPAGTAKITFTSGSTGEPKGVCLSTAQCFDVASSLAAAVAIENPRHLCLLPLSTLLENIAGLYMPLLAGGTSLVYPMETLGMAGSSGIQLRPFLEAISRLQPQTMILVPQLLGLLDAALAQGWQAPDSLKFIAVGGGRVAPSVVARVRAAGLPVYEGYGLSECASVVSLNTVAADRPGTSGCVLPHIEVKQSAGELVVSGNTFLGYLGQPRSWGATDVATGDLGSVDPDGFIRVSGRKKNVLVSSFGRNISPEWVESELLATDEIMEAVVLGDDRPFCSALLLLASPDMPETELRVLIDQVNRGLPDYARITNWHLLSQSLALEEGLITDNGRLKRERIREKFAQQIELLYPHITESIAL
ncbi:MAG: AMP-binding protein [Halioglobus sp.]